jgi:hypothetical protein
MVQGGRKLGDKREFGGIEEFMCSEVDDTTKYEVRNEGASLWPLRASCG